MRILTLLFLCFAINLATAKENYRFRHLTVHDGLADNEVIDMLKDQEGFLWCVTSSAINRFDGYNVKHYVKTECGLDLSTLVQQISIDKDNNIWIERCGHYFTYDRLKDQFVDAQPLLQKYQLHDNNVPKKIIIDKEKNIWSYNGKILKVYQPKKNITSLIENFPENISFFSAHKNKLFYIDKNNILHITDLLNKQTFSTISLNDILNKEKHINYKFYVDNDLNIWVYSSNTEGLWLLSMKSNNEWELKTIGNTSLLLKNKVINITEDNFNKIWIGLEYDGIIIYDKNEQQYKNITQNEYAYSLGSNKVWCFYYDNENTMWIGTMRNGISYYNPHFFTFNKTMIPSKHDISCQVEDKENNLWIGTDGDGIYKITPKGEVSIYKKELQNSFSNIITCLYVDSNNKVWAGTYLDGFGYYENNKFHQQPFSKEFPKNPINNSIWDIEEDNKGNLYLGNLKIGLHIFNPKSGYFHTLNTQNSNLSDNHVMDLCFDKKKSLYIATCNGTCVMNTEDFSIDRIRSNYKKTQTINDTIQNNIYLDSRNLLWIGGRMGLTVFDMQLDTIYYINNKNHIQGMFVRGITEDDNLNIWVVTTEGVTNIEPIINNKNHGYTFNSIPYDNNDGLQTSSYVNKSIYKSNKGNIIVGGNGGYYSTDPKFKYNSKISKVIFTNLNILDKTIEVDSAYNNNIILKKNIELTKSITLNYNQNTFKLSFSTMEYIRTHDIRFDYRLKGVKQAWIPLDNNYINFNNMVPGKYELEIKATNSKGIYSDPTLLQIEIQSPIWLNGYAKTLYVILFISFFTYILYREDKKHKRKIKYKEKEMEAKKLHEMDEMRLNFFTNLSHDFRTPLSLIIAPLEEMLKTHKDDGITSTLKIIHKNAKVLHDLVNQILDFRKIENQEIKLQLANEDYIQFIDDIIKQFLVHADTNQITLTFNKQISYLPMAFDKEKMQKIFMNLMSNAIKYTGKPGKITVKVWTVDDKVFTSVEDNGKGIKDSEKNKVFDAFYQVPNMDSSYGSGIGLHIVKELLTIHNGKIHIEDNHPTGCKFIYYIPIIQITPSNEENSLDTVNDNNLEPTLESSEKSSLLIVEDNHDLRQFLCNSLKNEYKVLSAVDGLHALSILKKENIDMVITDIMMPNMNGIELCHAIKNNFKFSHIPLIMLTAKGDIEHIKEGLTEGADDYIPKPFNLDILKLRINKILKWKQDSYRKFALSNIPVSDITSSSLDESFIEKIIKTIEDNIENAQFSVEELSNSIGISRSNLYNKIMAITQRTPSEFIRLIRLKKSLVILGNAQMTVSEVAYKVGFNSPKIFTHYFKEAYKMTPTEYRKQQESKKDNQTQTALYDSFEKDE